MRINKRFGHKYKELFVSYHLLFPSVISHIQIYRAFLDARYSENLYYFISENQRVKNNKRSPTWRIIWRRN